MLITHAIFKVVFVNGEDEVVHASDCGAKLLLMQVENMSLDIIVKFFEALHNFQSLLTGLIVSIWSLHIVVAGMEGCRLKGSAKFP